MLFRISGWVLTCALAVGMATPAHAAFTNFDSTSLVGATDPGIPGVTFSGGQVGVIGFGPYYKSCCQAYHVSDAFAAFPGTGMAEIQFDGEGASSVSFYFVHGGANNVPQGTATAFGIDDLELGTVMSFLAPASGFGTEAQVVRFDFGPPIFRIQVTEGGIDDFEFFAVPEPVTSGLLGLGLGLLALSRRTPSRNG